jgi:hypothetical protein
MMLHVNPLYPGAFPPLPFLIKSFTICVYPLPLTGLAFGVWDTNQPASPTLFV